MKKRILAALMTTAMIAAIVTGCGNNSNAASTATDTKEETADAGETTPAKPEQRQQLLACMMEKYCLVRLPGLDTHHFIWQIKKDFSMIMVRMWM